MEERANPIFNAELMLQVFQSSRTFFCFNNDSFIIKENIVNPILHGLSSMQFHMAHGYHNHPLRLRPVKVKKCKH